MPLFIKNLRDQIVSNRTYYVRTDGSDSNTGLVNSAGGAFLTIQKAINAVSALDISIYNVIIQLADGTYTGATDVTSPWLGSGTVTLRGNTVTPANVIVTTASGNLIRLLNGSRLTVSGFEVRTTGGTFSTLQTFGGSTLTISAAMRFGACTFAHLQASTSGVVTCRSAYSVVGGAVYHIYAADIGHTDIQTVTITLTGTPNFSGSFALSNRLGDVLLASNTFVGEATGKRYTVNNNSVMTTGGATLPGDVAGTTATGGLFN